MTASAWSINPGDERTRKEIHSEYGGSAQNGIAPSARTANILVYSDHDKAAAYGYDFDGWNFSKKLFYYTGEGSEGNQQFVRGNRAIRDHRQNGKALRLFVAVGNAPKSSTRIHCYVGEFEVDIEQPYITREAIGRDEKPRNVIVFRLHPVGDVLTDIARVSTVEGANSHDGSRYPRG